MKRKYLKGKRPFTSGETSKAKQRRLIEGFFDKYIIGKGLDIGFGGDLISPNTQGYDFEHGDAQYLENIAYEQYDFVYSSHTLEHMPDPATALKNWFRVLKKNGFLIIYIPHRDLYEKKKTLPSRFNPNHTYFFLIEKDEEPDTLGILPLIQRNLNGYELIYAKECNFGNTITDPLKHSNGEYSIEVVLRKLI
ncbi:MAG: class I SAM-dependent methyltransferase [Ignavibacteriaceae bacterium]|nr:class I SAM-dependent methyltransferase [Ignavibacteriaceae bacterium]